MEKLAPVILFTYNRPNHTQKTLTALASNTLAHKTELYIYSDGPKETTDEVEVFATREVLKKFLNSFKQVHLINSKVNKGLATSITEGVNEICAKFGKIIVLEDDIITSKNFLEFMNDCLVKYEFENRVMAISGYMHKVKLDCDDDAIFLPFISSWGWATWSRAWDINNASENYLKKIEGNEALIYKFNLNGAYPYFEMLKKKKRGLIKSWAIDWYSTVFFNNGLSVFPKESLVVNIGFDGTGENCKVRSINQSEVNEGFTVRKFPKRIEVCEEFEHIVQGFPKAQISLKSLFNNAKKELAKAIRKL